MYSNAIARALRSAELTRKIKAVQKATGFTLKTTNYYKIVAEQ